ncbi:MAG: hypothetical protein ACYC0X_30885 [Pirellulaceae bacterium]
MSTQFLHTPVALTRLEEKGRTEEAGHEFLILRYQISEDVLTLQLIDNEAKERAIEGGKIKGMKKKAVDGNSTRVGRRLVE